MAVLSLVSAKRSCSNSPSLKSSSTGQDSPTDAARFSVSRTIDGADPTLRATSRIGTPALFNRKTSRTWRIAILSLGITPPFDQRRDPTDVQRGSLTRATSAQTVGDLRRNQQWASLVQNGREPTRSWCCRVGTGMRFGSLWVWLDPHTCKTR